MRLLRYLPPSVPFRNEIKRDCQMVCWSVFYLELPLVVGVGCCCFPPKSNYQILFVFVFFCIFLVSDRNLSHSGRNDRIRSELLYVITMYD